MNQSLKFTPGPWHVQHPTELGPIKITAVNKVHPIALLFTRPYRPEEEKANAQLMAAAPELLDALTNLLDWAENQCGLSGNDECYGAFDSEEIVVASRLLERLKGETHGC